jgi:protein-S-isoprenylcysteine O-methyltransferase Ste14
MRRAVGIAFGVGNHILFAFTVWRLFFFLKGSEPHAPPGGSLFVDFLLAILFVVPHSVMLLPGIRQRLTRLLPDAFYGSLFCVVTCATLLIVFANWQLSSRIVWQFTGASDVFIQCAFYGSWIALFYSLSLTGLGYQTGWTPWWHWVRGKPLPARKFEPRGAYLWLRHPVYLSFLGLIWFVPVMTVDRAVLTATWTAYIFCGSWLKDQRLIHYLGDRYRQYQAEVPGYPGIVIGPLARIPIISQSEIVMPFTPHNAHEPAVRKAA